MIEELNLKSYALAFACVLGFNLVYSVLVHNVVFIKLYRRLGQHLFRPEPEIKTHRIALVGSLVLSNLVLTLMLLGGHGPATLMEGAVFGLLIGALLTAVTMSLYGTLRMPMLIAIVFALTDVGSTVGSGLIAAGVYRARPADAVALSTTADRATGETTP